MANKKMMGGFSGRLFVAVLVGLFAGSVADGIFSSILPASLGSGWVALVSFVLAAFVAYLIVVFAMMLGKKRRKGIAPISPLQYFRHQHSIQDLSRKKYQVV